MKLLIPTILIATIFIAGAFALFPVQEATTLHLSGTEATQGTDTVTSASITDLTIVAADIADDTITGAQLADVFVLDALTTIDTAAGDLEIGTAASAVGIVAILSGTEATPVAGIDTVAVAGAASGDIAACSFPVDADDNTSVEVGNVDTGVVEVFITDNGGAGGTILALTCIVFDIT